MVYFTVIPILFSSVVYAANDWSKPCLSGVCQYDLPSTSKGGSSGTVKVWGSQDAISDITTAANWEIIGCSPNATTQNIRLVCNEDETSSKKCGHLFNKSGPEGKIVRLPENCGKGAFARVAKSWVPTDQSIPSSISRRLVRRNGVQPQVKALTLDNNFSAANATQYGSVNFVLQAATIPGANGDIEIPSHVQSRAPSIHQRRGLVSIPFDWSKLTSASLPFEAMKSAQIFNKNIPCPIHGSAGAQINVNVDTHGAVNLGVTASGKLIPPEINAFAITASLSASLGGSINLNANNGGSLDSGKIEIFEVGIPALDFPGLLTISPSFLVNAEVSASLNVDTNLTVGINYNINNATFTYPPQSGGTTTSGSVNAGDTPLQLSIDTSVFSTGYVLAHIIPTLNLGISVLDGLAESAIFLDLDTSANATTTVVPFGPLLRRGYNSPENNKWNQPSWNSPGHNNRPGYYGRPGYNSHSGHNGHPSHYNRPGHNSRPGNHNNQPSHGGTKPPAHQPVPPSHTTSSAHPSNTSTTSTIASPTSNSTSFSSVFPISAWPSGAGSSIIVNPITFSPLPSPATSSWGSGTGGTVMTDGWPTRIVESSFSVATDAPISTSNTFSISVPPYGYPPAPPPGTTSQTKTDPTTSPSVYLSATSQATSTVSSTVKASSSATPSASPSSSTSPTSIKPTTTTTTAMPVAPTSACLDVTTGLAINVGATTDFSGLFDPSKTLIVYNKQFNLFADCFIETSKARRSTSGPRVVNRSTESMPVNIGKRDLSCPANTEFSIDATGVLTPVFDDTVRASNIKPQ